MFGSLRQKTAVWTVALAAAVANGQTMSLPTTYVGGNGLYGAMFDLAATGGVPLQIKDFAVNTATSATWQVYVMTSGTTWVGSEFAPAAWTLLGTTPGNVAPAGTGLPTVLGFDFATSPNAPFAVLPGNGQRVGFYVTATTSATLTYTNGSVQGALYASNTQLSFYEGRGLSIPQFSGGFTPRIFNGTIFYELANNILSLSQSGPGVGDMTMTVGNPSPTAAEGYMLLSSYTTGALAQGPILGIYPDPGTFAVFTFPYLPGSPFHFNMQDVGFWPQSPFVAPPGTTNVLTGLTFDVVLLFLNPFSFYDSRSNVVRHTFI